MLAVWQLVLQGPQHQATVGYLGRTERSMMCYSKLPPTFQSFLADSFHGSRIWVRFAWCLWLRGLMQAAVWALARAAPSQGLAWRRSLSTLTLEIPGKSPSFAGH